MIVFIHVDLYVEILYNVYWSTNYRIKCNVCLCNMKV